MKRIWWVVVLVILSAPHVYRWSVLGERYTTLLAEGAGVSSTSFEETYAYAPLVNRVRWGQEVGDVNIVEYRNLPSPYFSELVPAVTLGLLARLTSVPMAVVMAKILLPVVSVWIWVIIGKLVGFSKSVRLAAGLAAVFFAEVVWIIALPKFVDLLD